MAVYNFDTSGLKKPTNYTRRLITNSVMMTSPLSGKQQVVVRPGERWGLDVVWANLTGDDRADLIAFFSRLNGPEHIVQIEDPSQDVHGNRGLFGGTPVVDGANQTGNILNVRGATASVTGWIKAGDFISFGTNEDSAIMATADAGSDGVGDVVIPIIPAIRTSPADGATVYTSAIQSRWRMTSQIEWSSRPFSASSPISNLSLSFVEVTTA